MLFASGIMCNLYGAICRGVMRWRTSGSELVEWVHACCVTDVISLEEDVLSQHDAL